MCVRVCWGVYGRVGLYKEVLGGGQDRDEGVLEDLAADEGHGDPLSYFNNVSFHRESDLVSADLLIESSRPLPSILNSAASWTCAPLFCLPSNSKKAAIPPFYPGKDPFGCRVSGLGQKGVGCRV